ncbi:MAG: TIM barrel protein [Methanomassiliicoccaceae archaeon]|nr:TIM barrel protein [Methanomassiliicoccaceae archaeon]
MEHLYSISAYSFDLDEYGGMSEALERIRKAGADGIELLTGYFDPDPTFRGVAKGVHLPYATDWYSPWTGDTAYIEKVSEENIRYRSYGRNREETIQMVKDAIVHASAISPAYGVFHASNTRMDEVLSLTHKDSDKDVLTAVAELMNGVMRSFSGGEPPYKIIFENLWWPGLTMRDDSGYEMLLDSLEFNNWGLCLDTGHLMNHLGRCREEEQSIRDVLDIVRSYPREMIDRIETIHLHMSLSADYQKECIDSWSSLAPIDDEEMISKAYGHVSKIDQHRPFTNRLCTEIVNVLRPNHVTHEISAKLPEDRLSGFSGQLSLFG